MTKYRAAAGPTECIVEKICGAMKRDRKSECVRRETEREREQRERAERETEREGGKGGRERQKGWRHRVIDRKKQTETRTKNKDRGEHREGAAENQGEGLKTKHTLE